MAENKQDIQEGEKDESCEQPALSIRNFSIPLLKQPPEAWQKGT